MKTCYRYFDFYAFKHFQKNRRLSMKTKEKTGKFSQVPKQLRAGI